MEGNVTISIKDYDRMKQELDGIKKKLSILESEKNPKLDIIFSIERMDISYKYGSEKTYQIVFSNNEILSAAREGLKSLIEETVKDFIEKQEETKVLRRMPKWLLNFFIKK